MTNTPTDLTSKTWSKLKELTVAKTGFGEKLDAYQTAKKKTEVLQTRNIAAFNEAATALEAITRQVPEALKKCNKTLHKKTIEALSGYKLLVDKEGSALHTSFAKYMGYVDTFKHVRAVCAKEQIVIEKQIEAVGKSVTAEVKTAIAEGKAAEAIQHVKEGKTQLDKLQTLANEAIAKPRISPPAAEAPHADDRPDASVFTALIEKQNAIIGLVSNTQHEWARLIEAGQKK